MKAWCPIGLGSFARDSILRRAQLKRRHGRKGAGKRQWRREFKRLKIASQSYCDQIGTQSKQGEPGNLFSDFEI